MKEQKEQSLIICQMGHLTFLTSILCIVLHRLQKGKDVHQALSVFYLYCGINHSLEYKESKKKIDIVAAFFSFLSSAQIGRAHV